MRLDKCLADCGLGTRSEVKSLLKAKRITQEEGFIHLIEE